MTPERYARLTELFDGALAFPTAAERDTYLRRQTSGDDGLYREALALLEHHQPSGAFLTPPAAAARPTQIGPYALLEPIGEGGMGTVYRARRPGDAADVALKLIRPGMDIRPVLARFQTERRALALLDHPHIARLLDDGVTQAGAPYFVMELVPGVPVTAHATNLPLGPRLALFLAICDAVQYAHEQGVIHRDLKPSNILVTGMGKPVVKIIDFGLAKAEATRSPGESTLTQIGTILGSLPYMSPEQASGADGLDARTDVYSLGAILYELLTGCPALAEVPGESYLLTLRRIREELPAPPTSVAPALPLELEWIVQKALAKDRAQRYASVDALAGDLRAFLRHRPVTAAPPSRLYRARKFARRWAATAAAVLLIAVILGVAWFARERQRDSRHSADLQRFLAQELPAGAADAATLERAAARAAVVFAQQPELEAAVRQDLAIRYRSLDRLRPAIEQTERAIALFQQARGPRHASTLSARSERLDLQMLQGQPGAARHTATALLADQRSALGADHRQTLYTLRRLAASERQAGQPAVAEMLYQEAEQRAARALGPDDPGTLHAMLQLNGLYLTQGRFPELLPRAQRLVELSRRRFGKIHLRTADALAARAEALHAAGRPAEAEPAYQEALAVERSAFGSAYRATEQGWLRLLTETGRAAQAESEARQAIARAGELPTGGLKLELARALRAQGRHREAQRLSQDAAGEAASGQTQ